MKTITPTLNTFSKPVNKTKNAEKPIFISSLNPKEKIVVVLSAYACKVDYFKSKNIERDLFAELLKTNDLQWIKGIVKGFDDPKLVRLFHAVIKRADDVHNKILNKIAIKKSHVFIDGMEIGKISIFYKATLPYELQARISYDSLFDRFFVFLQQKYKIIVLDENDSYVKLFVPESKFYLDKVWNEFIDNIFSMQELKKTFILLLNSYKIADRGFGTLEVPIVSKDQALLMSSFYLSPYYKSLDNTRRIEKDLKELNAELDAIKASENSESKKQKRIKKLEKKIEKSKKDLEKNKTIYETHINKIKNIEKDFEKDFKTIRKTTKLFNNIGSNQIQTQSIAKSLDEIKKLVKMSLDQYFKIPPLLYSELPSQEWRSAGDDDTDFCYSCGKKFKKSEETFKTNKFIFENPQQRPQSSAVAKHPKVCGACAAISIVSPIKMSDSVIVAQLSDNFLIRQQLIEHLRMLTLGELNLFAGKYLLITSERIGNKPVSAKIGKKQYGLFKLASILPREVFETYKNEIVILANGASIPILSRHLTWLNYLIDIFNLKYLLTKGKSEFATVSEVIRLIEKDEVLFALYKLISSNIYTQKPYLLEDLRKEHVRWLEMDEEVKKAQLFRDVAALSGLTYAFCNYVESEARKKEKDTKREVRKLIEEITDPYHFVYKTADNLSGTSARLYFNPDVHFCYEEAKKLLEKISIASSEREVVENDKKYLKLYFDDLIKAYTYLFEERYKTDKDQQNFTYELKLGLYARFPQYIKEKDVK